MDGWMDGTRIEAETKRIPRIVGLQIV